MGRKIEKILDKIEWLFHTNKLFYYFCILLMELTGGLIGMFIALKLFGVL